MALCCLCNAFLTDFSIEMFIIKVAVKIIILIETKTSKKMSCYNVENLYAPFIFIFNYFQVYNKDLGPLFSLIYINNLYSIPC